MNPTAPTVSGSWSGRTRLKLIVADKELEMDALRGDQPGKFVGPDLGQMADASGLTTSSGLSHFGTLDLAITPPAPRLEPSPGL